MSVLFLVVGVTHDPTRVWPVTWDVDRDACVRVVEVCKEQQAAMRAELKPIWRSMEELIEPSQYVRRYGRPTTNKSYDAERSAYDSKRAALETREHAVNAKYRDSMLDVLFPTGNDGWMPEVEYVIWPVPQDWRATMTASELLLKRAKLHGQESADQIYEETQKPNVTVEGCTLGTLSE